MCVGVGAIHEIKVARPTGGKLATRLRNIFRRRILAKADGTLPHLPIWHRSDDFAFA